MQVTPVLSFVFPDIWCLFLLFVFVIIIHSFDVHYLFICISKADIFFTNTFRIKDTFSYIFDYLFYYSLLNNTNLCVQMKHERFYFLGYFYGKLLKAHFWENIIKCNNLTFCYFKIICCVKICNFSKNYNTLLFIQSF